MKGCGLTAAAGVYQRIELFDNAKALRVLCILIVPLIVKIFLNDFVDDLVDPFRKLVFSLGDPDPGSRRTDYGKNRGKSPGISGKGTFCPGAFRLVSYQYISSCQGRAGLIQ